MKYFLSLTLAAVLVVPVARALVVKPNEGPVVTNSIPAQTQYNGTTHIFDMTQFFKDPDASAAVQVTTSLGTMNFTLDGDTAPITVANFLSYVNKGSYFKFDTNANQEASLFFHRSSTNFVIQTGGFIGTVNTDNSGVVKPTSVLTDPPIQNEPHISNVRGTIAMAKVGGDPNSATSQWFINLNDNSSNLDNQNGGFTAFGRVAGNGMTVADAIAALPTFNFTDPFAELPLRNYTQTDYPKIPKIPNLVSIPGLSEISPLIYTATSSDENVATAIGSGSNLLITAVNPGTAALNVTATDLDGVAVSQSFTVTVTAAPARLTNISSRAQCASGGDSLIGGFIVRGSGSKVVAIRALGPTLSQFGITNPIANPVVNLFDGPTQLSSNDDWATGPDHQLLSDLDKAPQNNSEAALVGTVPADASGHNYTAVMQNVGGANGIGIIEIYDLDSSGGSNLHNLSSRGEVGTGDNIMIGGFIISGDGTRRIVARGIGPSLAPFGVPNVLPDPAIDLRDVNGNRLSFNDSWQANPDAAEIQADGLAPSDPNEAAVIATLPAGNYTALLTGSGAQPTGNALLEIYDTP